MNISQGRPPRELAPKGTHHAKVCSIIDLGTQPGSEKFPDEKHKIRIGFQILGERTKTGKNVCLYKEYTLSNSPNSEMMKMLEAGFGISDKKYQIDELLGKVCNLTIKHEASKNGNDYEKIVSYSELKKGEKPTEKGTEPLFSFYIEEPWDQEAFESLPDWLQTKIAGSPEYSEVSGGKKKKAKK